MFVRVRPLQPIDKYDQVRSIVLQEVVAPLAPDASGTQDYRVAPERARPPLNDGPRQVDQPAHADQGADDGSDAQQQEHQPARYAVSEPHGVAVKRKKGESPVH